MYFLFWLTHENSSKCELTNSIRSFIALYHQSLNEVAKIEMEKRTGRRDTVPYSSPIFSQFIRKEAIGDFKAAVRMIFSPDLDIEDIPKEEVIFPFMDI